LDRPAVERGLRQLRPILDPEPAREPAHRLLGLGEQRLEPDDAHLAAVLAPVPAPLERSQADLAPVRDRGLAFRPARLPALRRRIPRPRVAYDRDDESVRIDVAHRVAARETAGDA